MKFEVLLVDEDLHAVPNDNGAHTGRPQHVLTKHTEVDDGQEAQSAYRLQ
jgi:hypothetical protein